MKAFFTLLLSLFIASTVLQAQQNGNSEIGLDVDFSASNTGGNFGLGLKYRVAVDNPALAFGPSLRYQRVWAKNFLTNKRAAYNVFGGGIFFHYRFENVIYLGTEVEYLRTPVNFTNFSNTPSWVMTAFIGGGFSRDFGPVRVNAGLMYDVINHNNSPFRKGYFLKRTDQSGNTALIPLIYRFSFFFEV